MRNRVSLVLALFLALVPFTSAQKPQAVSGPVRLGQVVAGGSTASVTFSSIPQGYSKLELVALGRVSGGSVQVNLNVTFNSDSGSNYDTCFINGGNTAAAAGGCSGTASTALSITALAGSTAAANQAGSFDLTIPYYANTTFFKNVQTTGLWPNTTTVGQNNANVGVGTWRSTSAITSITVATGGPNYAAGTTFTLYGYL